MHAVAVAGKTSKTKVNKCYVLYQFLPTLQQLLAVYAPAKEKSGSIVHSAHVSHRWSKIKLNLGTGLSTNRHVLDNLTYLGTYSL